MKQWMFIFASLLLAVSFVLGGCSATYTIKAAQMNQQGQIYFQFQQYDQALKVFQESSNIDFENSATHYWMGRCYQVQANPQKAIEEYRLAVRFSPALEVAQVALITALHQVGQLDESIIATKSYMKYKTGRACDLVLMGNNFAAQGMEHQALLVFERAQELEPTNAEPAIAVADFYLVKGDVEKEKGAIIQAVGIDPFYPGLTLRAGRLGIKVESPRPQPLPRLTPLERALRGYEIKK